VSERFSVVAGVDPPVTVPRLADRALADHVEDGLSDFPGVVELLLRLVGVGFEYLAEGLLAARQFEFVVTVRLDQRADAGRILVGRQFVAEVAELDAEFTAVAAGGLLVVVACCHGS